MCSDTVRRRNYPPTGYCRRARNLRQLMRAMLWWASPILRSPPRLVLKSSLGRFRRGHGFGGGVGCQFAAGVGGADRDRGGSDQEDAAGGERAVEAGGERVRLGGAGGEQVVGAGGGDHREDREPERTADPGRGVDQGGR